MTKTLAVKPKIGAPKVDRRFGTVIPPTGAPRRPLRITVEPGDGRRPHLQGAKP
jgi:hypothetical protein